MKKPLLLAAAAAAILSAPVFAGERNVEISKQVTAPEPPVYGTGFYLGLQAGINAYQDYGDNEFRLDGVDVTLDADENVGFVGGLKVGYVFGRGIVRGAIEADLYYNGVDSDIDAHVAGGGDFNASADLHTGAFMGNFLVRFAFDRFQPYLGGGVGGYYAESQNAHVTVGGATFDVEDGNDSGFAWQLVGGADYYFTEKFSVFAEYKFLNYEDASFSEDRLAQHLVVLGLRIHF